MINTSFVVIKPEHMNPGILKKALPHTIAIITFIILSYAFFYPVLEGKQVNAHDTKVFVGSSKEIRDYRAETGQEPLWTNSMFGGMPAFLISTLFPGNLFKNVDLMLKVFKIPVAALFLAFLGFYLMLLLYGVRPWLALTGALAYGLTTFLFVSLSAGHNTKVYSMAYMAPVLGSVIYAFRKNALKGAVLFSLFLSLQMMSNHLQITYYTFMLLVVFGAWELAGAIREKTIVPFGKTILLLMGGAILAAGVNFGTIYTTWDYGKESTRGKSDLVKTDVKEEKGLDIEYITQWSYGVGETMTLLIPGFRGGATEPFEKTSETVRALRKNDMSQASSQLYMYWGKQPTTSGPVYFGAIILFLFITGMIIIRTRDKWWILTAVLLSVMLAWGKNMMFFTSLFVDFFPGYDRFRAVTMILVIAGVCVPFLATLAIRDIIDGNVPKDKIFQAIKIAAGITGGLALVFFLFPGLAGSFISPGEYDIPDSYNWLKDALITDRKQMLRNDALRSVILILGAASVVWFYIKNKLRLNHSLLLLTVLILIDLAPVGLRFMNETNFESKRDAERSLAPTFADKVIMEDKDEFRVLNLTVSPFNDASTSYYHHSVGGYHGAKLKRYQELIESSLSEEINSLITVLRSATSFSDADSILARLNALNMLNTRYMILNPDAAPLQNRFALGNAWFVDKTVIVENANEELAGIKTFSPSDEAIVDKRFAGMTQNNITTESQSDTIFLTSYKPDNIRYSSRLSSERTAVFSEIYYPRGWKAFIDEKPAEHFRADYVLRAMVIPAGEHEITFMFEPEEYKLGNNVALASSVVLFLLLAYSLFSGIIFKGRNG